MEIQFTLMQKHFEELANLNLTDLNEYQNKYYLTKKTMESFPDLSEKIIYDSIEATNRKYQEHQLSKIYIVELCANIFARMADSI